MTPRASVYRRVGRPFWIAFLLATFGLIAFAELAPAETVRLRSGGSGTATAVVPGTTTVTGCQNRVLFGDNSQVLQCDAGLTYTGALLESIDQTNISGPDATTNVEIGSTANDANAGTGGTSTAIGNNASNASNGADNTIIGSGAAVATSGATRNTAIGTNAAVAGASIRSIAIGSNSSAQASFTTVIGESAVAQGQQAIVLGYLAGSGTATNHFVAGSGSAAMSSVYFGQGITNTSAANYFISGTGGTGSDNAGGGLLLSGGPATGSAQPGDLRLQTSTAAASSSTAQTRVDRLWVEGGTKTLTDASATTVFTVTLGNDINCGGQFFFSVRAADATNEQNTTGSVNFSAVDTTAGAGGEACSAAVTGTNSTATSAGTLTVTADATTGTDLCNIRLTATGSLTETVGPWARYSILFNPDSSTCVVNPQ